MLAGSSKLLAQNPQNFDIISFDADYYLTRNEAHVSGLKVIETIVAKFPDFDQNHGIERAIPKVYENHTLSLHIESVKDASGTLLQYSTYPQSDNEVLRIGNPDAYVHGEQTYVITYTMKNVVKFFDDHEEFYWDVNGDQWAQEFGKVTARIHLPPDIALNLHRDKYCYAGSVRTQNSCLIVLDDDPENGAVVTARANRLGPYQTMTVVLGFGEGTFELGPEVAQEKLRNLIIVILIIVLIAGLPFITLIVLIHRWRKFGRDPRGKGVIVPEYQPPKNLSVLKSDYVLEEGLRTEAITALLIELAIRKYLVIYETKETGVLKKTKHYELELIKSPADLSAEQQDVVEFIFGENPAVGAKKDLDTLKNKLATKVSKLDKDVSSSLTEEGYFTASPQKVRKKYTTFGAILLGVGFGICFTGILLPPGIGLLASGLIVILFAKAMPARSQTGVTLRDYLYGVKDYIKMAEADRLRFLQSPEGAEKIKVTGIDPKQPKMRVKLFEELLPYAILFGLEKQWAKQFEDIYKEAPDWYRGNVGTFSAVYFASSMGSLSSVSANAFTAPSSSSSSGMGGGGFSGGGGGGGGGGGW